MTATFPAIETKGLTKKFGNFTAVKGLDLSIKQGQLYALLGPNGSGKTTAIKMIVGILRPTAGEARVLGRRIPDRSVATKMAYMPQETAIYKDLTVHENMWFMGQIYGVDGKTFAKREKEILKFIGLEDWKDEVVQNLSGGMKHRTSLACALVPKPRILILDEPTVGVDPELRANFWEYFQELKSDGTTLVITTHYMDEARHCEKVGFLRDGRLIIEGDPTNIMERTGTDNLEDAFLAVARGKVEASEIKKEKAKDQDDDGGEDDNGGDEE